MRSITLAIVMMLGMAAQNQTPSPGVPIPIRNDVPRPGRELLVLRNHQLKKGGHESFYQFSRQDYWPYFERLGARIVGQWKVIAPQSAAADREDVYRLVRYAGFEHWQATRAGEMARLGGNGPAYEKGLAGLKNRGGLEVGSKGAYFLEGRNAPGGPYFMPGLAERYEQVQPGQHDAPGEREIPARLGAAQPGEEIVQLKYQRIAKGAFDRFVAATETAIWPWEEKLGARPIGQWRVVHPVAPSGTTIAALRFITGPHAEYDEVVTLTRFASRAHMDAMAPQAAVSVGGNGPDWQAWRAALAAQATLTTVTSVEIVQGFLYQSPPVFLPGLTEQYRRVK